MSSTDGERAGSGQEPSDDALRLAELAPQGGSWSGLLFDNPGIGLEPALTWSFDFQFDAVARDYGESPVSLTVAWVPLPGADWHAMAEHAASGARFGEPVECSAYFFEHHRYDSVDLRVLEQQAARLRVAVEARGDLDGLGVPEWNATEWLDFDGIYVQLSDVSAIDSAAARLADFVDTSRLAGASTGQNFKFLPLHE